MAGLIQLKQTLMGARDTPQSTALSCIEDAERRPFPGGTVVWTGSGGSYQLSSINSVQALCSAS